MICPHCSQDITEDQTVCPNCHLALSPVATPSLTQQQVAIDGPRETRFVWGGFIAIFVGVLSFFVGGAGGIVFGLICIACGIATLAISRFGTRWNTLSSGQRALVYPGWIIGLVYIGGLRLAAFIIKAVARNS